MDFIICKINVKYIDISKNNGIIHHRLKLRSLKNEKAIYYNAISIDNNYKLCN
jgi:hypothetical protein